MPTPQQILTPGRALGGFQRAADQFLGARPVEPAAALRGVHRFGDAEPEVPEIMAEGDGALPVDRGVEPGVDIGERIGDHMRGGIGDAVEALGRGRARGIRSARRWCRAQSRGRRSAAKGSASRARSYTVRSGTSYQRLSAQLFRPSSTSCTPLAPFDQAEMPGRVGATWRRKSSHWILKPLS